MNSSRLFLVFNSLFLSSRTPLLSLQQNVNQKNPLHINFAYDRGFYCQENFPWEILHPYQHAFFFFMTTIFTRVLLNLHHILRICKPPNSCFSSTLNPATRTSLLKNSHYITTPLQKKNIDGQTSEHSILKSLPQSGFNLSFQPWTTSVVFNLGNFAPLGNI